MKKVVLSFLFVAFSSWLPAETIIINDEFDDGTLGVNTNGTGSGFTSYGQTAVTESSGQLNMDTHPTGVSTLVAQSNNTLNPFQTTSTTLVWQFGTINRDSSGQRLYVGYRISSSTSNHFLPGVQGLYVAIAHHDGPGSGNTNPPGYLIATDQTGASTTLATWTWGVGTNLSGLKVELTTSSTNYSLSFVGASPNLSSGSLTGNVSALGTIPSSFATAIHNQYWNTPAQGGVKVASVSARLNGPEISVEEPVSTSLTDGSSTIAFGNVRKGTSSTARTVTIRNTGDEDLSITNVTLDGTHSGDFSTNLTSLDGTVAPGGSTTFTVTFSPQATGARSAALHILSDDADEGSFDISLSGTGTAPLVAIKGNGTTISNGDSDPTTTDHSDFGSTPVTGGSVTRTFTISNTGTAQLLLTGTAPDYVTLTGSPAFSVTTQPTTPVAATNGTTTFQVTFDPGSSGEVTAVVSIGNDDDSADPYTFTIQGTGTEPPTVESPTSGSLTPSAATLGGDVTDDGFSPVTVRGVVYSKTSLNSDPEIGGASVFNATTSGTTGVFTVDISSLAEATQYSFKAYATNILGTSYTAVDTFTTPGIPEIGLEQPSGTNLADGVSSIAFGSIKKGQSSAAKTFTIRNNGTADLTISSINVDGSSASDFDLDLTLLDSVINPGDTSTFTVTFSPSSAGALSAALHVDSDDDDESSFDVALGGTGTVPEIAVSGNGIEIASGDLDPSASDDTDFGYVSLTGSGSRLFSISNTGDAELELSGSPIVEIVGADASDFNVVATPNSPLDPLTGLSTFEIEFTPGTTGLKEARVVIASDDDDEPLYEFAIEGTAVEPSVFSYSAEHYNVKQGTTSVTLTLNRTGGTNPTSIRLATTDGTHLENFRHTYEGGQAGSDYVAQNTIINFAQDETSKDITITLLPKTGVQPNYIFWAVLSDAASGNSITADSTGIRIYRYSDPAVTVLTPGATATAVSNLAPYQISGYVRDYELFGIDRVEVVLNGAPPVNAVLGSGTSVVPWTLDITPTESGSNTITVKAYDDEGFESAEVSRTFTYTRRYKLGVSRTAPVALSLAGTVTVAASPATAMTSLTAAALVNASPKEYSLLPGTAVKLTATPKAGYVFSHWSGQPSGATESGPILNFVMPGEDVGSLTAHFVANPFATPAGQGNVFYGLLRPASDGDISNDSVGFATGTMTATSGAFSGKVLVGGLTQSFAATFYGNGSSLFTVGATKQSSLSFGGGYSLTLAFSGGAVQASLTKAGVTSTGTVKRVIYSSTNKVAGSLLNTAVPASGPVNQGFFTVAVASKAQSPAVNDTTYPQGDGYHTLTLSNLGVANLIGTLADGSTFTASSALVAGNTSPIFAQLVTPGGAATSKGGSFSGVLAFDSTQADTDVSGSDLLWTRPAVTQVAGTTVAAKATQLYTAGWPSGIRVDAVGALYNKTTSVQNTLGVATVAAGVKNTNLEFTGNEISGGNIVVDAINILGNVVSKVPKTNATFTLSATASTGSFTGTFSPGWTGAKPAFKGLMLQKGGNKGGFGFFIGNQSGDLDPESGRVVLTAP